jgi:SAM-dependent methyltransferase
MIYVDGGAKLGSFVPSGSRLLDIGCGTGRTTAAYREKLTNVEIFGVDGFHEPAEVQSFIRYTKHDVDGTRLPYEDAYFDVVVLNHILEHVRSPVSLINETCRVLRPGGIIYLETPSVRSMFVPDMRFMNEQYAAVNYFDDFTHVGRPQTIHSLFHLLNRNGFDVVEVEYARPQRWIRIGVINLLRGLRHKNRNIFSSGIWHLVGWSIYGIARKNDAKRIPSYV